MPLRVNLNAIQDRGVRDSLKQIVQAHNNLASQLGVDSSGPLAPPANIGSISVTAADGIFDIAIVDRSRVTRAINYFAEYSETPDFQRPVVIQNGTARNLRIYLGNITLYWRGYSMYLGSSGPSAPVTFGTPPTAVVGGGTAAGPAIQPSQGSGTATSQQGGQGFGISDEQPINDGGGPSPDG